ncbi:hypothetical protein C2G38_2123824 [Gigaspora rosea]|uniref:Uncharacterized protein n=1 Tax=Gigaspora rosea TaxID=44941 RepID=A0A397TYM1_9GLOM|nr:hypothetical protein C2G38_2123824 [Gigaspora rosea]
MIRKTSIAINNANEVERSAYVAAIFHGVLATFHKEEKVILHREYSLSDANGKGRFDFTITQNEDILCVAEVKAEDREYGLCQNLVQIQSACQNNKKRKHASLEYVYGIVTTGGQMVFLSSNFRKQNRSNKGSIISSFKCSK